MKKNSIFFAIVICLVGVAGYFLFSKKGKSGASSTSVYRFSGLDSSLAAKVTFKKELNGKKVLDIPFQEVLDEHYKSLNEKKHELLFLAAYEQMIRPSIKSAASISLRMEKPQRALSVVCNQYGVHCEEISKVLFSSQQKDFVVIDGKSFDIGQLQQKTVPLLAVKTEILNHVLQKIDESLRIKMLYHVSKEFNLTVQEFIAQKIISDDQLEIEINQSMDNFSANATKTEKLNIRAALKEQIKNTATGKYLIENYIRKPIIVNVEQPQNDFKTRWDWTPFFGSKSDNTMAVVLFADFFSDASKASVKHFLRFKEMNGSARFGVRPYFNKEDQMEWMAAEFSMCVWSKQSAIYWKYLENAMYVKKKALEKDLYQAVQKAGGDVEAVKKCFLSHEVKKVVEYHIQSAEYLKIINPPVVFVGNEVHIGPLNFADLEKMLARQPQ